MPNQVRVGVGVTGARGASSEIDKFRDKFTQLQKQGAKGFAIGAGAAITAKGLGLLDTALSNVIGFAGDAAQAFIEDQHSIQTLNTSLKANVAGWDGNTAAIERVIKARMALGFSDEEQRQSLAGLVAATHDVSKALDVERVAMDLARFKNISLADASEALTKVEAGSYRVLKSLGIQLKDGATQTEALAAVEKIASGQAADFADTIEGRVVVAQTKAREAEEKLGKGLAELESVILPPVADAISGLADDVDNLAYKFGHLGEMIPKEEIPNTLGPFFQDSSKVDGVLGPLVGHIKDTTTATKDLSRTFADADGKTANLRGEFDLLESQLKDTSSAADDFASTLSDQLFGKAITKGHETDLRMTIRDLYDQREEVKKGSSKWLELTGQIAENEQALFDLHFEMAKKEGPKAVLDFLDKERRHVDKANTPILAQIDALDALYKKILLFKGISFAGGGLIFTGIPTGPKPHAAGGFAAPGELSLVGEKGPELRVEGNRGSTYVPLAGSAPMGSTTVNINVSTPVLTPGGAEALARAIGPTMVDYFRRRALV